MTKKEATTAPPLMFMFEQILCDRGLFADATDWRELRYACHVEWLAPLLRDGHIAEIEQHPAWPDAPPEGKSQFNYHTYKVTPQGIGWWAKERTAQREERAAVNVASLAEEPALEITQIFGKGIGGSLHLWFGPHIDAAIKGIRDGLFQFESYYWGNPSFWRMNDALVVSLTPEGYEYFLELQRRSLQFEAA